MSTDGAKYNAWNEDTRVKLPAILHLTRLWYKYISLKDTSYEFDSETNIIKNIFVSNSLESTEWVQIVQMIIGHLKRVSKY